MTSTHSAVPSPHVVLPLPSASPVACSDPRVRQVGPEHFGIVAFDCAEARSKFLLADSLRPPPPSSHPRPPQPPRPRRRRRPDPPSLRPPPTARRPRRHRTHRPIPPHRPAAPSAAAVASRRRPASLRHQAVSPARRSRQQDRRTPAWPFDPSQPPSPVARCSRPSRDEGLATTLQPVIRHRRDPVGKGAAARLPDSRPLLEAAVRPATPPASTSSGNGRRPHGIRPSGSPRPRCCKQGRRGVTTPMSPPSGGPASCFRR